MRLGQALLLQGKADAALQEMQQETDEIWRLCGLPLVFHALGRRSESDAALAALKSKYAGEMAYQIAEVHAFRGEADLAFEWLERAYDQRDGGLTEIKGDRLMRGLVGDPRYKALLRKLKLPGVSVDGRRGLTVPRRCAHAGHSTHADSAFTASASA